jgi:hypothetical protein
LGLLALLLGPVEFPAKLNTFGEAGLCSLIIVNGGNVPVLFLVGCDLVVPGGTLNMLPGGSVIVFPGFVAFPVLLPKIRGTLVVPVGSLNIPTTGGPTLVGGLKRRSTTLQIGVAWRQITPACYSFFRIPINYLVCLGCTTLLPFIVICTRYSLSR